MIKSKKLVCEITPQLAEFLGEPGRKKMSRTEVTRQIDAYIQKNNLQDVMNPTNIYPDIKLMTLLLSAFSRNPRPYPKMITFEMLRDIISNHCILPRYEEYYYRVPGPKSKHLHLKCFDSIKYYRDYHETHSQYYYYMLAVALMSCTIIIIVNIAAILYKIF